MYRRGERVIDAKVRAPAIVAAVERVPATHDLFGRRIPACRRYVVVFDDGRWSNDRTDADLIPA
jgi:hypothetical protein